MPIYWLLRKHIVLHSNMGCRHCLLKPLHVIYTCRLLHRLDVPPMKFTVYFLGYENPEEIPKDDQERIKWVFSRRGTIELSQ